jgi:hypothetical protein
MKDAGVKRLISVTGLGAGDSRGHGGLLYDAVVFPLLLKRVYDDKDVQEWVIRTGTKAKASGNLSSLDATPYLFLVLWDQKPSGEHRCRIWCVRPKVDEEFRKMAADWYKARDEGEIKSDNFQLHPPRGKDTDLIRNTCGNLEYPLLLCAERDEKSYVLKAYNPEVLETGLCKPADPTGVVGLVEG